MGKSCELSFRDETDGLGVTDKVLLSLNQPKGVGFLRYKVSCDRRHALLLVVLKRSQYGKIKPEIITYHEKGKSRGWFNQRRKEILKEVAYMTHIRLIKAGVVLEQPVPLNQFFK